MGECEMYDLFNRDDLIRFFETFLPNINAAYISGKDDKTEGDAKIEPKVRRKFGFIYPVEEIREDDTVEMKFEVPGVKPSDIKVWSECKVLHIEREGEEIYSRNMTTLETVGKKLDMQNVKVSMDLGILTVSVPYIVEEGQKRVEYSIG